LTSKMFRRSLRSSKRLAEVAETVEVMKVREVRFKSQRIRKEPLSRHRLCRGFCCVVDAVERLQRSQRLRREVMRSRGDPEVTQAGILAQTA